MKIPEYGKIDLVFWDIYRPGRGQPTHSSTPSINRAAPADRAPGGQPGRPGQRELAGLRRADAVDGPRKHANKAQISQIGALKPQGNDLLLDRNRVIQCRPSG